MRTVRFFTNVLCWFFLSCGFSTWAGDKSTSNAHFEIQDGTIEQRVVVGKYKLPVGVDIECVRRALSEGSAPCRVRRYQDWIVTWFSFPIQIGHTEFTVVFSKEKGTNEALFIRDEHPVFEYAWIPTIFSLILPLSSLFFVYRLMSIGDEDVRTNSFRQRKCNRDTLLRFLVTFFISVALCGGIGWLFLIIDVAKAWGLLLIFLIACATRFAPHIQGCSFGQSPRVFFTTCCATLTAGELAFCVGWDGAKMSSYLCVLAVGCCAVMFLSKWFLRPSDWVGNE